MPLSRSVLTSAERSTVAVASRRTGRVPACVGLTVPVPFHLEYLIQAANPFSGLCDQLRLIFRVLGELPHRLFVVIPECFGSTLSFVSPETEHPKGSHAQVQRTA